MDIAEMCQRYDVVFCVEPPMEFDDSDLSAEMHFEGVGLAAAYVGFGGCDPLMLVCYADERDDAAECSS